MFVHHSAPNVAPEAVVLQYLRPCRFDGVPERLEQRADVAGGGGALRVDRTALGMMVEDADAQPTGISAELLDVRTRRRGCDDGVADSGSTRRVEKCRAVAHGPADAVLDRQGRSRRGPGRA